MLASIKKRLDDSNPARAATAVENPHRDASSESLTLPFPQRGRQPESRHGQCTALRALVQSTSRSDMYPRSLITT